MPDLSVQSKQPQKNSSGFHVVGWMNFLVLSATILIIGCDPCYNNPDPYDVVDRDDEFRVVVPCELQQSFQFLVLIDPSEEITELQKHSLRMDVCHKADSLKEDSSSVKVYRMAEDPSMLMDIMFDGKVPLSGDHATTLHEIPKDVEKNYLDNFKKPLEVVLDSVLFKSAETNSSPLIESMAALAEDNRDCNDKNPESPPCLLWIVSDMLQHSKNLSFYRDVVPKFDESKDDIDRWIPKFRPTVSISLVYRCKGQGGDIQDSPQFRVFWNDYFEHATGSKPIWDALPGESCRELIG